MKKQYTFITLLIIMLYMIYLVLSYKYDEYRVFKYTQNLSEINKKYLVQIQKTQEVLENKNTRAYKNKVLKSQQWLKNPGEEVVFLITEEKYKKYTQDENTWEPSAPQVQNLLDEESLLSTMTIYQKWFYFLWDKDIR